MTEMHAKGMEAIYVCRLGVTWEMLWEGAEGDLSQRHRFLRSFGSQKNRNIDVFD